MKRASFTVNLKDPSPNEPASIFHQGQSFLLAGSRCLLEIDVGPGVTQCLVSPGVVNLCLSIELFLKSLVAALGQEVPKTHKLVELAEVIPRAELEKVKLSYSQVVSDPTFECLLAQINDFFVRVRYGYEFEVFAYYEIPVLVLAKALYVHSASAHGIKIGIDRVRV